MRNKETELISVLVGCGTMDVECLLDMENNFGGTWVRAIDIADEIGATQVNFGCFVMAVKDIALDRLEGEIPDNIHQALQGIIIDDNCLAWGGIVNYGHGGYHEIQELFANWLVNGDKDIYEELIQACQDEECVG